MCCIDNLSLSASQDVHHITGFDTFPFGTRWGIFLGNSGQPSVLEHVLPMSNLLWVPTVFQIPEELLHRLQVSLGQIAPCSLLYGGQVCRVIVSIWVLSWVCYLLIPILDEIGHLVTVLAVPAFTIQLQGELVQDVLLCSRRWLDLWLLGRVLHEQLGSGSSSSLSTTTTLVGEV